MAVRSRSRAKPVLAIAISFLCLAVIAAALWFFLFGTSERGGGGIKSAFQVEGLDPSARTGALPGAPHNEKSPGENLFSYRINETPKFESNGTSGDILVQNPAFNTYLMVLEIAEGENLLYASQYIAPNQYIESIDLQTPVESGEHQAVAYLNAIDPQTLELVGTLEYPITITIK